jgi:hypothetical protein
MNAGDNGGNVGNSQFASGATLLAFAAVAKGKR